MDLCGGLEEAYTVCVCIPMGVCQTSDVHRQRDRHSLLLLSPFALCLLSLFSHHHLSCVGPFMISHCGGSEEVSYRRCQWTLMVRGRARDRRDGEEEREREEEREAKQKRGSGCFRRWQHILQRLVLEKNVLNPLHPFIFVEFFCCLRLRGLIQPSCLTVVYVYMNPCI